MSETGGTTEPNSGNHFVESAVALVNAALGVGAAFTKTVAIATAGDQPVPTPPGMPRRSPFSSTIPWRS